MAFTVKYVPLSPGGSSYPQARFPEGPFVPLVPLSQGRLNASLSKELEDLIRQARYMDPLAPIPSTSTLAAQNPANFSEAIPDIDSADYFSYLISDQFNQADFPSTPSTVTDESMDFDFTNTSLDGGDPAEFSSWDHMPENGVEDWMLSATFSPEAISELENLLSSFDQYMVPSKPSELDLEFQKSIEEYDREQCADFPTIPSPPCTMDTTDEMDESRVQ